MLNEKSCISEKQPEFATLLNELGKENSINRELTDKIGYFSKNLCEINSKQCEDIKQGIPVTTGVLGALYEQVYYLRKTNDELNTIANHLQLVIGS